MNSKEKKKYNYLISFIIPVYNRKNSLKNAINSILCSDFKDYEIILIDDASTDGSTELCKEYQEKDTLFKAICLSENYGPGYARNKGIDIAKGKWIYFLDSDDEIVTSSLKAVADKLYKLPNDISLVAIDSIWVQKGLDGLEKEYMPKAFDKDMLYTADEFFKEYSSLLGVQIWNYIFSYHFLKSNNIYFLNFYFQEDCIFQAKAGILSDKIYIMSDIFLKYYKLNNNSLTFKSSKMNKKEDLHFNTEPFVEYCKQYQYAKGNKKIALYNRIFQYVVFFGIQFNLPFNHVDETVGQCINLLANEKEIQNINKIFEKLFSLFYQELLKEPIYITPASKVQRSLAKRLISDGGHVVGMFDNYLGDMNGKICCDFPPHSVKIYPVAYLEKNKIGYNVINIGSGRLSLLLKKQFEKYGVKLF